MASFTQDGQRYGYVPRREDVIDGEAYRARLIAEGRLKPDSPPVVVAVDQPTLRIGRVLFRDEPEPRRRQREDD